MSESPSGIDNTLNGLKNRLFPSEADKISQAAAEEAVHDFLKPEDQDIMATFSSDSESVFDLKQRQSREILRIEEVIDKSQDGYKLYSWFVMGNGGRVYKIKPSLRDEMKNNGPFLILEDTWKLERLIPTNTDFRVEDAMINLLPRRNNEGRSVTRLNVYKPEKASAVLPPLPERPTSVVEQ